MSPHCPFFMLFVSSWNLCFRLSLLGLKCNNKFFHAPSLCEPALQGPMLIAQRFESAGTDIYCNTCDITAGVHKQDMHRLTLKTSVWHWSNPKSGSTNSFGFPFRRASSCALQDSPSSKPRPLSGNSNSASCRRFLSAVESGTASSRDCFPAVTGWGASLGGCMSRSKCRIRHVDVYVLPLHQQSPYYSQNFVVALPI